MFAPPLEETIDHALARRRAVRRRGILGEVLIQAQSAQRLTAILREADDEGDWKAAGCTSSAQWLAEISHSEYRSAVQITKTSDALRALPALDRAMSDGLLSLEQVAAAIPFATPETDAHLARVAVGKAPSQIALAARTAAPPVVADDQEVYRRRALSMSWTQGHRELVINGRLPLEQGIAFEDAIWSIAKQQRAADKKDGVVLGWQQSAADALVTLARQNGNTREGEGVRRSLTTLIVHLSDDEPPMLEGAGPISIETAERLTCTARRMTIKPTGNDIVHSHIERCVTYAQKRALVKRSKHCQYPGCSKARELDGHHMEHEAHGGQAVLDNLILLCDRHHKHVHDNHIRTSGKGISPAFTDAAGRLITTSQPHAPPA